MWNVILQILERYMFRSLTQKEEKKLELLIQVRDLLLFSCVGAMLVGFNVFKPTNSAMQKCLYPLILFFLSLQPQTSFERKSPIYGI